MEVTRVKDFCLSGRWKIRYNLYLEVGLDYLMQIIWIGKRCAFNMHLENGILTCQGRYMETMMIKVVFLEQVYYCTLDVFLSCAFIAWCRINFIFNLIALHSLYILPISSPFLSSERVRYVDLWKNCCKRCSRLRSATWLLASFSQNNYTETLFI